MCLCTFGGAEMWHVEWLFRPSSAWLRHCLDRAFEPGDLPVRLRTAYLANAPAGTIAIPGRVAACLGYFVVGFDGLCTEEFLYESPVPGSGYRSAWIIPTQVATSSGLMPVAQRHWVHMNDRHKVVY